MNEAAIKRTMVQDVRKHNGYARRFEDQYGVGIFDLILIPKGLPVFFTEVKIVRGDVFGPTPRQLVELNSVDQAMDGFGHAFPLMIGWREGVYYFSKPKFKIDRRDCFSVTTSDMSFEKQLRQYYLSQRGTK
jgi:hypothetical protein